MEMHPLSAVQCAGFPGCGQTARTVSARSVKILFSTPENVHSVNLFSN